MTNRQYYQLVQNYRRRRARPAVDGRVEAWFLRRAARELRQRAMAQRALERVLPARWLKAVRVEIVKEGAVTIAVRDVVIGAEMQRDRVRLQRELGRTVRGLRRVHISLAAGRG